jgi:cytochrome c-type biogenesis protein CcmF
MVVAHIGIAVFLFGATVTTLLRRYKGRGIVMGQSPLQSLAYLSHIGVFQVAIDPSLFRDLYIALGESLGEGAWSLRLHDFIFCLLKYLLINQIILQVLF